MSNPVPTIASNTFRQTVRQKLFLNVGVFGIGMVMLSVVVGHVTYGYTDRVVRSIGLSGVSIALDLMALLVGVGLVHDEIDRKTLFVVLTRPVARWQYLTGRYLGLVYSLSFAWVGLVAVYVVALFAGLGSPTGNDFTALFVSLFEAVVVGALGIALSCFTTPMLGTGMGLGIWVASSTADDLVRLTRDSPELAKFMAKTAYYALPALARFNFREAAVYHEPIALQDVAFALVYGCLYSIFLIGCATSILNRREMT